jgi:lysophospholipase L1-like esterase
MSPESRRIFLKKVTAGSLAVTIPHMVQHPGESFEKGDGLVFLFQGDSITDGNRGRNQDPNHIMGHGYAFSIASRLGYAFPEKKLTFINKGISGNKVTDLEKRWKEDTLDLKPDVLSVLVGINDSSSVVGPDANRTQVSTQMFNDIYRSLLDKVVTQNPNVLLVLNQPFVFKNSSTSPDWEKRITDLTERQRIAEKIALDYNAVYVKLQEAFDEACKKAPVEYWIWDGVHPTVAGHEVIAKEWLKQVGKRLTFLRKVC